MYYTIVKKYYNPDDGIYYYKTMVIIDNLYLSFDMIDNLLSVFLYNKDYIILENYIDEVKVSKFNNEYNYNNFDNTLKII